MPERRPRAPAGGRAPGSPLRLPGRAGQAEASISLRQAALYFLALLAGMFVALLMDSGGNTSALRPGAAKNRCATRAGPPLRALTTLTPCHPPRQCPHLSPPSRHRMHTLLEVNSHPSDVPTKDIYSPWSWQNAQHR